MSSLTRWWREQAREKGAVSTTFRLVQNLWVFALESTPERRRERYGDMDYDWENRVNTTSGTVGWQARLLGLFHSPYQPTDPMLFHEMMASLPIDFTKFTFVDLGSGKGRALLLASEYPFKKIVGVELLAELHGVAEENIGAYRSTTRVSAKIESVFADAREFEFSDEPLVLYLFNPLPERALSEVLKRLENSVMRTPRPVWVVYHNPLQEQVLAGIAELTKVGGTRQYSIYAFKEGSG
jgi:SAM-dependent methyltransferase